MHPNPDNRILHTALVGEMNGFLQGLTLGTDVADAWGQFGGPRAYTKLIQPLPFVDPAAVQATIPADAPDVRIAFPVRPADAPSGSTFQQQIKELPRDQREAAVLQEIINGNVPEFLRRLVAIRVEAMDDAVSTFWQHHRIIEERMRGKSRGLLVAGIKKDIVLTNRLKEKPHKVAIYGWHESHSQPIQSLYVGHVDWYVDYSHGVRLMSQRIIVDNQPLKVSDVLKDSHLCPLLSTEGPIDVTP